MPVDRIDLAGVSFPLTCFEDEGDCERLPSEYDANGHYVIGPRLAPSAAVRMIARNRAVVAKSDTDAVSAAASREYRRSIPAPKRGMAGLVDAIRGRAA